MPRKKQTKTPRTRTAASKKRSTGARTTARRTTGAKKSRTQARGRRTAERSPQRARGDAGMDLFETLRTDHRQVAELFDEIIELVEEGERDEADDARCLELFRTAYQLLTAHSKAEEQAVYAALVDEEETSGVVLEARIEHGLVETLLEQVMAMDEVDPMWIARVKVVSELVKHHVKEEEGEMFARARKAMNKTALQELAVNFERLKGSVLSELGGDGRTTSPHPN